MASCKFNFGEDAVAKLETVKQLTGANDLKSVINQALTLYTRTVHAVAEEGKRIAFIDDRNKVIEEIETPAFAFARKFAETEPPPGGPQKPKLKLVP